jgi:hypothetical protein
MRSNEAGDLALGSSFRATVIDPLFVCCELWLLWRPKSSLPVVHAASGDSSRHRVRRGRDGLHWASRLDAEIASTWQVTD